MNTVDTRTWLDCRSAQGSGNDSLNADRPPIQEQAERIEWLEKKCTLLGDENDKLRDELADRAFPAETAIENMEQAILTATKKCVEALRGMRTKQE